MTLYIEIDGAPVRAKDVVWITRAKCGCISGVSFANSHATSDAEMILTPEQNASAFETPKVVAERRHEDGFTDEPITEARWNEISNDFREPCSHKPQWGRVVVPVPEGTQWKTSDRWYRGRRTHKKHLAPTSADAVSPKALCGAKAPRGWSADSNDTRDCVTCRRCEAKATALADAGLAKAGAQ